MTTNFPESRLLRVQGRVQGVGFRWALAEQAEQLGLQGWVRNRRDGSVEALVWGAHEAVAAMIRWAGTGPSLARVTQLEVERSEDFPAGFRRLPDA